MEHKESATRFDVHEATIRSVRDAIINKRHTCRDIVSAFITRIEDCNGTLNAMTCLNPDALSDAHRLDTALRDGGSTGPLFGVPILVKDNYDVLPMPTTASCAALSSNYPSSEGPVIRALRDAGAIILGKTNMSELALEGLTVSSLVGQTMNPYDLTRTPGGSSGGTAAAVAASFAVFGLGSDTVNSLRSPASACSLYSFRPSRGLISKTGVIPVSETQDSVGAIGRSLEDIAIALTVMAEHIPDQVPYTDYSVALSQPLQMSEARIGMMKSFCSTPATGDADGVSSTVSLTLDILRSSGSQIMVIDDTTTYDPQTLLGLDVQIWELRENLDSYLTATTGQVPRSTKELYSTNTGTDNFLVIPYLYSFMQKVLAASKSDPEYTKRLEDIARIKSALQKTFDSLDLDAIVYPEQRNLVVPVGSPNQAGRNGILAAVTGFPVVTIPMGFSEPSTDAPVGVPFGIEILGRPWSESKLLRIAHAIETSRGSARKPPILYDIVRGETAVRKYDQVPSIKLDARKRTEKAYVMGVLQ